MKPTFLIGAGVVVLATAGFWVWARLVLSQAETDLRLLDGFEGMHLDR